MAEKDSAASGGSDAADSDDGEEESFDEESSDAWVAVDPPHGNLPPVLKRVTSSETSPVPPLAEKMGIPGPRVLFRLRSDGGKLSKADRKALKKKLLEERMKRQQGKESHW